MNLIPDSSKTSISQEVEIMSLPIINKFIASEEVSSLNVGDVVALKSQEAPLMTVCIVHPIVPKNSCRCCWFDQDYNLQEAQFRIETLRLLLKS